MRLYNTAGATQVDDPEFGTFKPDANGAFDGLPDPMYAKLHGRPGWESEAERAARLTAEQMEKLRDPATMLAELQKMTASQGELTSILANAFAAAQAPAAAAEAQVTPPTPEVTAVEPTAKSVQPEPDEKPAPAKASRASKKAVAPLPSA
jgi:hypothetical protein